METTAFFEKKIHLTPLDMNELKKTPLEELLLTRAKNALENKCSEHGFVLPGSIQLLSRSMGYFEAARFTGDTIYYVKLQGQAIYPVDRIQVKGTIIRKNKMGLYVNYRDAIHIQVPRDLHLGNIEYDLLEVGDDVLIEIKRSKFAINDPHILSSGLFISKIVEDDMKQQEIMEEMKEEDEDLEDDESA
jgi:hypothetical protein